jgi:proton-dependent oligopeptide transporter, POT family
MKKNPPGLYVLFYTEIWELFGRFGITALLVLYLTNMFHMSDAKAFSIYSGFIALIYVMPIIGGYFSDRWLGLRHAIVLGASLMALGDALMIIPREHWVFLGLAVVAVGSGFFLPSIVPLVGRLYKGDRQGRDAGFTWYYIGKNIGALLAPISCGLMAKYFNYNYAFILSTLGMLSGIVVFLKGQKHLVHLEEDEEVALVERRRFKRTKSLAASMKVYVLAAIFIPLVYVVLEKGIDGYLLAVAGVIVLGILIVIGIKHDARVRKNLCLIVLMMLFVVIFSGLLGQGGTTLNLFIERIIDRHVFGWLMPPSFFYTLDPVFMILAGPFIALLWAALAKRAKEPSAIIKFALAMMLLGLGFYVFVVAAHQAMIHGHASAWFVVLGYCIFPMAELCIMPIGLSFVTRLSPKNYDALMVGIWMLGYSASGYLTGVVSDLGRVTFALKSIVQFKHAGHIYAHVFAVSTVALGVCTVLLVCLRPLYRYLSAGDGINDDEVQKPVEAYY